MCDLAILKRIDILAVVETWLTTDNISDPTLADIINTLHLPREMLGSGVGFFLRKGLNIKQNEITLFNAFEYIDISISTPTSSMRFVISTSALKEKQTLCLHVLR